jgi:PAS domain S-box-containing protein
VPEIEYKKIKVDEKGVIWFMPGRTLRAELVYNDRMKWNKISINDKKLKKLKGLNSIEVIYRDDSPEVFLSAFAYGIMKYYKGHWKSYTKNNGLLNDSINNIGVKSGVLYAATPAGLYYKLIFNKNDDNFKLFNQTKADEILSFTFINRKPYHNEVQIIVLGKQYLYSIKNSEVNILGKNEAPYLGIPNFYSIAVHQSGDIFWGNSAAIFRYDQLLNKIIRILVDNPTSDKGANKIFIDYEGNIWLPGLRGLYKLKYSPFVNFNKTQGLQEDEVTAISENGRGEFLFGHNYGITLTNLRQYYQIKFENNNNPRIKISRVLDIKRSRNKDETYFVSFQNGVGVIKNRKLSWARIQGVQSYYAIYLQNDQKLYVTTDRGLFSASNDKYELISYKINHLARKLQVKNDTSIYIANNTGLIHYIQNNINIYTSSSIEANNVYSFFEHPVYGLLVGSAKGLFYLDNKKLIKFNFDNQNINEPVYFIIQDLAKNIWLGTNNGVLKWDGKNLKRYNKNDGLAGNETNRAAGFVDSKGNVWIGTDEGVSMYTGDEPDYSSFPPKVMLLDFTDHSNFSYSINKNVSVDPDKNNITFHYRGLSFLDEKRNSFQIKLSGINGDYFNEFVTKSTSTRFNNLDAGDYIFSVRVKNSKGIWSKWQSSSVITIKKHFYQEPVFLLGIFGLFLFITYSAYSYFQQKKYTQKLEKAVDLRTKNLRETQIELITSINRYKGIVESQSDLVVRVDSHGVFTFVNDSYCSVFGKDREELIGKSFTPLIHPDDVQLTLDEMKKLNYPPYRIIIEQRALTAAGYRWFSWEDYAIHDNNGNILEIQAVGRDITLQKEIETELEKRVKERTIELQSLIQQSPLGILTFDANGYLLTFNNSAKEMFNNLEAFLYHNKDFNILNDKYLIENGYKEKLLNLDSSAGFLLSSPIKISKDDKGIYSNLANHYLVYRIYSVAFDDENKIFVLLLDDVTEQQKSEEVNKILLQEKIRISTIINTIETERDRIARELHDGLGQLLTTAKLKLDLMKITSEKSNTVINDTLSILLNAGDEIRRIINDLKPSDVESFGLISSIEILCERIKQASGINIQFTVSSNSYFNDKDNELIIYRIVQEALNNIVKHSLCNKAEIEIINSFETLIISIRDDGNGIDLTKLEQKGKTFGIYNIKERVKSLNGKLKIESTPGNGFQYYIEIPTKNL